MSTIPPFLYFGTPAFAATILDELEEAGMLPTAIITAPDKPRGRKLVITPTEVKAWGLARNIPVLTPERLDQPFTESLRTYGAEFFIVAAYGKIIPKHTLDLAPRGTLNVHPSLLPHFRGPSPIESAILSDDTGTGVSIMLLDELVDHGPVLAQRERIRPDWPTRASVLRDDLAHFGGKLLAEVIPEWLNGLTPHEQDHSRATFTKKITKEDGLIDLSADATQNLRKIRAYDEWPGAYYFHHVGDKSVRIRITDAHIEDGKLVLDRIIPEGKKELSAKDYFRNFGQA